jgi:inward rectifier potassium channel
MFRIANHRGSEVVDASLRVTALLEEETAEGHRMRRLHDLGLMRDHNPILLLSWLVVHTIDETSPLHGKSKEDLEREDIRIIANMTGIDGTFNETIYAYQMYLFDAVIFDHDFVDVISRTDDGKIIMDIEKLHDVKPVNAATK